MLFYRCQILSISAILTIAASLQLAPKACASIYRDVKSNSPVNYNVTQAPSQEQLDRQREAERVLKEGKQIEREVREQDNRDNNSGSLERQVGEQINKVRESGSDPQQVREAERELKRLRDRNNNRPIRTEIGPILITPFESPGWNTPAIGGERFADAPVGSPDRSYRLLGSVGFKDGNTSPSIGLRWNNFGVELGGIFNQDRLPGVINNFSLPSNFFFTDLGLKKLSPQWGADLLGFVDVSPRVSVYGSVGIYFQNVSRIAQSLATNELYKQTDDTNITGAVGGGLIYDISDSLNVGLGYHSLRGLTVGLGVSF